MNLNNLTDPTECLKVLCACVQQSSIMGLTYLTNRDELPAGYMHAGWERAGGVGCTLNVRIGISHKEEQPGKRCDTIYAHVHNVTVTVTATMQTVRPAIAIAQAALHREVAELGCLLEAMLATMTVGIPCNACGVPTVTTT